MLGWFFRKAFFFPDAAIQKSSLNPPDGQFLKAQAIYTVPNGLPDEFERFRNLKSINRFPVILFVGLIREEKGVEILIEAAHHGHRTLAVAIPGRYPVQARASHFRPVFDIAKIVIMVAGRLLASGMAPIGLWRSLRPPVVLPGRQGQGAVQ